MTTSFDSAPGNVPPQVMTICRTLRSSGARAWVVGGSVRDRLLGRPVNDWDLATDATPDQVRRLFRRVVLTGLKHGTVTVMMKGQGFEVTTLRGEDAYSDGRHPDHVYFVQELAEDLQRRDFTINAIAYDPLDDTLHDPFGGREDLTRGVIRAVGEPDRRFAEDSLRLMRAARFSSALGFVIEPDTLHAMSRQANGLQRVAVERISDELFKLLLSPKPSVGLQLMRQTGLLHVVLPELVPTIGCSQNHYHAYDVWEHTLSCVDAVPAEPHLRLAALLHDVAKPATRKERDDGKGFSFIGHDVQGAEVAKRVCQRLHMSAKMRDTVFSLVQHHLVFFTPEWTDQAVRRWTRKVTTELIDDQLALAEADIVSKGKPRELLKNLQRIDALRERVRKSRERGEALGIGDLAIRGGELIEELNLTPGPLVGETMRALLEMVLQDPTMNERDVLLQRAKELLSKEQ